MPLEPPIEHSIDEVREALAPLRAQASLAVMTPGNPFAVGAIIRVCHSFLLQNIILIGTEPYYEKGSMGMHQFENIVTVRDENEFFAYAGSRPVWALEREQATTSLYNISEFPDDVILCAGSERYGYPPGFLARCSKILAIPLYGINNSLPLAIAVGITLSQWSRHRYQEGATF